MAPALPPRGPNPIAKYARWNQDLITVQDRRFLRSLRIANDLELDEPQPPRPPGEKGNR